MKTKFNGEEKAFDGIVDSMIKSNEKYRHMCGREVFR